MLIFEPRIGKTIKLMPAVSIDKNGLTNEKPIPAKIVYINWPHRYFTAEFTYPGGNIRESFKFYLEGDLPCRKMH